MGATIEGGLETGPTLSVKKNKVVFDYGVTVDLSGKYSEGMVYTTKKVLEFENDDQAQEYYYKNR